MVWKDVLKNYKFILFIIFAVLFILANTINKNLFMTDVPDVYGFPLTHYQVGCGWCIQPCLSCNPGFRPMNFVINLVIWVLLYLLVLFIIKIIQRKKQRM